VGKRLKALADELSLYVKHLAWLHAVPRIEGDDSDEPGLSRLDQLTKEGKPVKLPPVTLPGVAETMFRIGPYEAGAMGAWPLSWGAIVNWQLGTGIQLSSWEFEVIHSLSEAYFGMGKAAEKIDCKPPWGDASAIEIQVGAVLDHLVGLGED